ASGAILLGDADNQCFELPVDGGTAWRLPLLGAVKLLGHEFAMPAENCLGLNDLSHSLEGLLAQLLADHGEGLALAITQPDAPFKLVTEDAVFRHQVLVAQQWFLIDSPSDIREQVFPIHRLSPVVVTVHIAGVYP